MSSRCGSKELVHLPEHLLDTLADVEAFLLKGRELSPASRPVLFEFGGMEIALSGVSGTLLIELSGLLFDLSPEFRKLRFCGDASVTFTSDDLNSAQDLVFERLKLVCADGCGCTHASLLSGGSLLR